jgi:glycosyltransferase involved in cell wall biosynthesis
MYREKKVGVVVPAYNEEALICKVIKNMPGYVDRIFVVDDCSTDRTVRTVLKCNDPRTFIRRHSENKGVGAAIATGYRLALEENMDLIAVMAGDDQMDPLELPKLLDPVADGIADYSKGDRLSKRELTRGMSNWRKFGNYLLTLLTRVSSGYWTLQDPQNGYTVISAKALARVDLSRLYPRYGYCNDLLVKLNVLGLSVVDVPIPARYGEEKSKIRYGKYICSVSLLLLRNFLWRIFKQYQYPKLKLPGITYAAAFVLLLFGLISLFVALFGNISFFPGAVTFAAGKLLFLLSTAIDAASK